MFNIYLQEPGAPLPEDDICYIIAKNGTFMKKKMGPVETLAKVDKISILDELQPTAKYNIPKMPANLFAQIVAFMRAMYDEHKSESMVLIFLNQETGDYVFYPPKQEVTGGGIQYERDYVLEGYNNVGTIHSHANMSAFHSGVDVDDEKDTDGIHITIGKCGEKDYFDATASLAFNGTRFPINVTDYVEGLIYKEVEIEIPTYSRNSSYVFGGCGHVYGIPGIGTYQNGISSSFAEGAKPVTAKEEKPEPPKKKFKKVPGYIMDLDDSAYTYPESWNGQVSKPAPIVRTYSYGAGGYTATGPASGRNSTFGNEKWQEYLKKNQEEIDKMFLSDDVVDLLDDKDFEFLPSEIENLDFNPCYECIFASCKITMEMDGELDDDVPDFNGVDQNFLTKEQIRLFKGGEIV